MVIYNMKLSIYAKKLGISYKTAWRYFKQGKLDELNKSYVAMLNKIKLELIKSRADLRMVTKVTGT